MAQITQGVVRSEMELYALTLPKVCVNSKGEVISSKFTQQGTTATDLGLIKTAEKGVKNYKFSPGELDKQCGTITVNFKLK